MQELYYFLHSVQACVDILYFIVFLDLEMGNLEVWTPGTRLFPTERPGHGVERSPSRNGILGSFFAPLFQYSRRYYYCRVPGTSIAVPGCLSQILDPDFYPSRIPDLGSRISDPGSRIPDIGSRILDPGSWIPDPRSNHGNKRGGGKNLLSYGLTFTVARNITKLKIILFLNQKRKKVSQFKKNYSNFYPIRIQEQRN